MHVHARRRPRRALGPADAALLAPGATSYHPQASPGPPGAGSEPPRRPNGRNLAHHCGHLNRCLRRTRCRPASRPPRGRPPRPSALHARHPHYCTRWRPLRPAARALWRHTRAPQRLLGPARGARWGLRARADLDRARRERPQVDRKVSTSRARGRLVARCPCFELPPRKADATRASARPTIEAHGRLPPNTCGIARNDARRTAAPSDCDGGSERWEWQLSGEPLGSQGGGRHRTRERRAGC